MNTAAVRRMANVYRCSKDNRTKQEERREDTYVERVGKEDEYSDRRGMGEVYGRRRRWAGKGKKKEAKKERR